MKINPLTWARKRLRGGLQSLGWDVKRYRPKWPTLLGIDRLPVATVLDIGAYNGDTARVFRHYFPQATLYCFEPQPEPYQALAAWASTQQDRARTFPYALGSAAGAAQMTCRPGMNVCASLLPMNPTWVAGQPSLQSSGALAVQLRRLDDMAAELALKEAILVKIDTEGYEREVILGGENVLRRAAACIVETNLKARFIGQPSLCELSALLGTLGMNYAGNLLQRVEQGCGAAFVDALFVNRDLARLPAPGSSRGPAK